MFFRDLIALAASVVEASELAARAGIPDRRYVPFFDYPMSELLRLTVEVAKAVYPSHSLGAGLRLIGRTGYATFLSSHAGRVATMTLGNDVHELILAAPKLFKIVMNFGELEASAVGERCVHTACRKFPAFLETYQVGVVEGVFQHFDVSGQVRIALTDIATAVIEARWD